MTKIAVIAFGGNALLRAKQKGTYEEQIANVTQTCQSLLNLVKQGYNIVIGHGNGPQVGNVMLQHEAGLQMYDIERQPLDLCVAETQGSIAYLIEQSLHNIFVKEQIPKKVVSMITQVLVNKDDPMMSNPTKPVGPYYSEEEVEEQKLQDGCTYKADPKGNGWRKVVPSPTPIVINNIELVKQLALDGYVVITVGGGGISVVKDEQGILRGIEAVIDKDLASALAAVQIGAELFYILTDVPKVYINFKKPNEQALDVLTVSQAKVYLAEDQFTEGSMAPKIRAALYFVEHGGKECIITEAGLLGNPAGGTRIVEG
ncbi:MAG: carbamate kinase [Bacteroidales bacterium]|jgi:carbamate kinase|nr:carbamate kinase [Bacteroidales bacterium]